MNIDLLYVHSDAMGYGRLGVRLAKALEQIGIAVNDNVTRDSQHAAQVACWLSTPAHAQGWWKGQHPAIFTMWEATELPVSFREHMHEFETIVVPSEHNLELFSQYHDNVRYVPLGVDPVDWQYRERLPHDDEFRFLIGGSGPRKGTDLVHKAFLTLWGKDGSWGSGPTPKLIMKSPRGGDFYGPRVQMVTGKLSAQEEIDLYAYAHCYVQPSRGEGFGLQPLQAIAQGMPTILTDAHGHKAFSFLGMPLSWTYSKSDYFIYGDAGDWWEPDFDELCDLMKDVYENYDEHRARATDWSRVARREFTWEKTARTFADCFDPTLLAPYDGPWEWHEPERQLFRAVVKGRRNMEIAGKRYAMEPGEDYWVPADVKRILFEANALDPACLTDGEHGLTEAQLERRGLYAAYNAYCPSCRQKLNSTTTIDDDLLGAMAK